jgi:hypothetical protein
MSDAELIGLLVIGWLVLNLLVWGNRGRPLEYDRRSRKKGFSASDFPAENNSSHNLFNDSGSPF